MAVDDDETVTVGDMKLSDAQQLEVAFDEGEEYSMMLLWLLLLLLLMDGHSCLGVLVLQLSKVIIIIIAMRRCCSINT